MTAQIQRPLSAPPYLQIKKLWKHYSGFAALKEVSLEIKEGEFVCFLGPSGCGKTTLLRAIAGLDLQSKGQIWQGGRDVSLLPPEQRDFGIVFQSYALFPNLTVANNIAYGLRSLKLDKNQIQKKVRELLHTIGLPDVGEKYPSQLSGGQQQRIALARALATEPSLLLLDEPLSALDARVRLHLRQEIRSLQQKLGITTIMVTHDQEEALTMADRIVVMNHGIIEQVGTPEEIYQRPNSAFVANFVGTMNLLPCHYLNSKQVRMGSELVHYKLHHNTAHQTLGFELNHGPVQKPQKSKAWLAFRPEVAELVPFNHAQTDLDHESAAPKSALKPHSNAQAHYFQGQVLQSEFMGSFFRLKIALHTNHAELVQQPIHVDIAVQQANLDCLTVGHRLTIKVPVDQIQVYERNDSTPFKQPQSVEVAA
ncbi:ABC transporter [Oceanospirillum multiglobuliferum]|uniref:ABC transporter domain-containing protein n=1 Tax=Oceanospirillum multiglobuliferum TaxID=64969 RepID=A0A1T4NDZ5_9GAMM|nr:putative 2-aminoethylphosphonate ABC transporter ATP-binding protein [Oceanospirillum multiglobuliferum]OPX55931.1 hypothetical protein BTE48_06980 [Oceanospirillum multiglobuliferum]SJZ77363.1 ABC transporter [Oceanospirillum multiglobuliferum]